MTQSQDDILLVKGNNELNVQLVPLPPIVPGVAIVNYKMMCGFGGNGTISIKITIANNTGQILIDQSLENGRFRVTMYDQIFKAPANDFYNHFFGGYFLPRPLDRTSIPSVSPGIHEYSSYIVMRAVSWSLPYPPGGTTTGSKYRYLGIVEGTIGFVKVVFQAIDVATTPGTIIAKDTAYFTGKFSTSWQNWQPTNWRPPEENGDD